NHNESFSFKTGFGKYLSSDKYGIVEARAEAIGLQEEWKVIQRDDGWAIMNAYDKFLSFDAKTLEIRCDSEHVGFNETFQIQMQSRYRFEKRERDAEEKRKRILMEQEAQKPTDEGELEFEMLRRYHSWNNNKFVKPKETVDEIKAAKLKGNLHEVLLDRRSRNLEEENEQEEKKPEFIVPSWFTSSIRVPGDVNKHQISLEKTDV
ncbi:hypothetical protein ROZALSC1DRAFT_26951, partial [Rozella allomycis CSF55]